MPSDEWFFGPARRTLALRNHPPTETAVKNLAVECLYKIAAVLVAVLLYGVIAILQTPAARAAQLPAATLAAAAIHHGE